MMIWLKYLISFVLFCCLPILSFGQGCIYDEEADGNAPIRPRLMTRDYSILPESYSLKQYCPTPMSQGNHGTCTAWATTYAARTICEAINNNWTDADSIRKEAFAPIFIYKQIIPTSLLECRIGSSIGDALNVLKTKGAPKFSSFDVLCADSIPTSLFAEASHYKIDSYAQIFNDKNPNLKDVDKVKVIKKALCENHPVVFGMTDYNSFQSLWQGEVWNGLQDSITGSHAMCVIGYDNEKYGGAFEVMNSWGTDWASGGFVWIKYNDFCNNTEYAYDMYLKKGVRPDSVSPSPTPTPITKCFSMAGSMAIVGKDGGDFSPVSIIDNDLIPYYTLKDKFLSGKRFRLEVSNNEPAFVYVIASDKGNQVNILFPYADNISPYLNYSQNDIAIPDETHLFELDTIAGTDYFCVLYSQAELDINKFVEVIKRVKGSFYEKLVIAFGKNLAMQEDITYCNDRIGFTAKTDSPIVPLIVEIPHRGIEINSRADRFGD